MSNFLDRNFTPVNAYDYFASTSNQKTYENRQAVNNYATSLIPSTNNFLADLGLNFATNVVVDQFIKNSSIDVGLLSRGISYIQSNESLNIGVDLGLVQTPTTTDYLRAGAFVAANTPTGFGQGLRQISRAVEYVFDVNILSTNVNYYIRDEISNAIDQFKFLQNNLVDQYSVSPQEFGQFITDARNEISNIVTLDDRISQATSDLPITMSETYHELTYEYNRREDYIEEGLATDTEEILFGNEFLTNIIEVPAIFDNGDKIR